MHPACATGMGSLRATARDRAATALPCCSGDLKDTELCKSERHAGTVHQDTEVRA